jgi:hypothetical protein
MSGNKPREGARHFSLAARESVAAGDPFDHLHRGEFRRRSDDRDLLAALLLAEGLDDGWAGYTSGGLHAARRLGLLPPTGDTPAGRALPTAARELCDLGQHADMGGCRTPEALRSALLGTVAPRDYSERDEADAGIPLAAWAGDDAAMSEEGC